MILDFFGDLNWLAVIVATLAYFALGAVWYSNAVMGKQYRDAIGATGDGKMEPSQLVINFVGWFVTAITLGLIAAGIGASTALDGIVLGLVVWLGIIAMNRWVAMTYEQSGTALARVNGPYNAIGFAVMGLILAVWT